MVFCQVALQSDAASAHRLLPELHCQRLSTGWTGDVCQVMLLSHVALLRSSQMLPLHLVCCLNCTAKG